MPCSLRLPFFTEPLFAPVLPKQSDVAQVRTRVCAYLRLHMEGGEEKNRITESESNRRVCSVAGSQGWYLECETEESMKSVFSSQ